MPSLNLTRWRAECLELAGLIDRPEQFQAALGAALTTLSHRLLRPGRSLADQGALPCWNVPALMLQELQVALLPVLRDRPNQALVLADRLWQGSHYEEKALAVFVLQATADPDQTLERLLRWARAHEDPRLLKHLAERGTEPLRRSRPQELEAILAEWIDDRQVAVRRLGWMALHNWLETDPDQAAAMALRHWSAALRERDHECQREARAALVAFARQRPWEAMRLIEDLPAGGVLSSQRLLRGALPMLPQEVAEFLRGTLERCRLGG